MRILTAIFLGFEMVAGSSGKGKEGSGETIKSLIQGIKIPFASETRKESKSLGPLVNALRGPIATQNTQNEYPEDNEKVHVPIPSGRKQAGDDEDFRKVHVEVPGRRVRTGVTNEYPEDYEKVHVQIPSGRKPTNY